MDVIHSIWAEIRMEKRMYKTTTLQNGIRYSSIKDKNKKDIQEKAKQY